MPHDPFRERLVLSLNERAWRRCDELAADAERQNISVSQTAAGTRIIDCGVEAAGGLEAGRRLAEICLGDCGQIGLEKGDILLFAGKVECPLFVTVRTDQPLGACMAAQYAGWQISEGKYFAMGSGPMRAAACREPLFERLNLHREQADRVVG